MNALSLISSSLRLIGALASGEVPTANEAQDSLMVLNQMLDSWNAERLMVFTITIAQFNLTPNTATYTYGTGGMLNGPRPAKIDRISIVSLTNASQPLELPIDYYTDWDWQQVPVKIIDTTLPQAVYDDGQFPFRNLTFWPIPTVPVQTRIYGWTALGQYPDLQTDLTFPPGYSEAMRYNLAMRLIAEFPGAYNPVMVQTAGALAVDTLARVRSINIPIIEAYCDVALQQNSGRYNYYSDTPVGGHNQ